MESKINIIYFNKNQNINEFTIEKPNNYNKFIEKIKEKQIFSFDINVILNKKFITINENNFSDYINKSEFIIFEKEDDINQSQIIYNFLSYSFQNILDEKTICCICNEKLVEKPYYCYNCNKLYCNNCFDQLEISNEIKCNKCKENKKCCKEFCSKCNEETKVKFAKCRFCFFQLDKKNWCRLINYDRNKIFEENTESMNYERLMKINEFKFNKKLKEILDSNKILVEKIKILKEKNDKLEKNIEINKKTLGKDEMNLKNSINIKIIDSYLCEIIYNLEKNIKDFGILVKIPFLKSGGLLKGILLKYRLKEDTLNEIKKINIIYSDKILNFSNENKNFIFSDFF